jgi:hypothetical protein
VVKRTVSVLVLSPGTAGAADGGGAERTVVPSSMPMQSTGATTNGSAPVGNGCTATSNAPHMSYTEPTGTWVHAEGRVDCGAGNYQSSMYITGQLVRTRWYGEEQLDYRTYSKGYSNWINITNTHNCRLNEEHTYRNYNHSESVKAGIKYVANTSNEKRFICRR